MMEALIDNDALQLQFLDLSRNAICAQVRERGTTSFECVVSSMRRAHRLRDGRNYIVCMFRF